MGRAPARRRTRERRRPPVLGDAACRDPRRAGGAGAISEDVVIARPLESDVDAEEDVISFLLIGDDCKALRRLRPRYDFTADRAEIYQAIEQTRAVGVPIAVSYVIQQMHPDVLPRLQALRDDAIRFEIGVMAVADAVDRLERCRHRRIVGRFAETLAELAQAPDVEFDCQFAALVDHGFERVVRSLSRADIHLRRPVCVRHAVAA
jgi:hypothetical protein